ncbi:MAG: prenyltransferase [Candidatus Omnitrophota bacterium]
MPMQIKYTPANIMRALRLPFLAASCFPFIFGSLIERGDFNFAGFFLGLVAVAAAHLSANLANDYFDSRSLADWQDRRFFGFFGGSKLIQEGIFTEWFYLRASLLLAAVSFISVLALAVILNNLLVLVVFCAVIVLSWQYTAKPLSFSYKGLGEFFIFLFFGPVTVMGGYFIQTGIFPDLMSFLLGLPFGFFTLAILLANEIADCSDDKKVGKKTCLVLLGAGKGYIAYFFVISLGFSAILLGLYLGYLGLFSVLSVLLIPQAVKGGSILKDYYSDKLMLLGSSRLVINLQAQVSMILILSLII